MSTNHKNNSFFCNYYIRPFGEPSNLLPFNARSVGHRRVDLGYIEDVRPRNHLELFWCINGSAEISIEDQKYLLTSNSIAFYLPWNKHRIYVPKEAFEFRWLTLDGPLIIAIFKSFKTKQLPHYAGPCPEELFDKLENEINNYTTYGERHISLTAYNILMQACNPLPNKNKKSSLIDEVKTLIKENLNNTNMNVNWLAAKLNKNRSSLSRLFNSKEETSLCEYITALKQQKAANLLKTTSLTIKEIAIECGYSDPNYFSKVFQKTFKRYPDSFRKYYSQ